MRRGAGWGVGPFGGADVGPGLLRRWRGKEACSSLLSVCVWTWRVHRDQNWKLRLGVDIGLAEMPFFFPFAAQRVVGREGPKEPQVAIWGMFRENNHANYGLLTAFADKTCAGDVHDGFEVHSDGISGGAAQVARSRDRPAGLAAAKEAIFLPYIR